MWEERTCRQVRQWQHWGSGCYQYTCEGGRLNIIVMARFSRSATKIKSLSLVGRQSHFPVLLSRSGAAHTSDEPGLASRRIAFLPSLSRTLRGTLSKLSVVSLVDASTYSGDVPRDELIVQATDAGEEVQLRLPERPPGLWLVATCSIARSHCDSPRGPPTPEAVPDALSVNEVCVPEFVQPLVPRIELRSCLFKRWHSA